VDRLNVLTETDESLASNQSTVITTVYPFDLSVSIVDTNDPVSSSQAPLDYSYIVTVTNISQATTVAGFSVAGGLHERTRAAGVPWGWPITFGTDASAFATVVSITPSQGTCGAG